ncbi:MAG: hypothetical protein KAQ65_08550 [Candidatus Thorarchaeota archaeon]|nr:hypothetical protein [Candidatus Thorarchaeota archaeon]
MDIEGVVIFDSKSGIPLFSKLKKGIDASLFSSFVTAITHFSRELKLGGLSSFTTEEKRIILAAKENTITALITPTKKEFQEAHSLAMEMGRQFEELHVSGSLQERDYNECHVIADEFMKKIKNPFISRVAAFVHGKYGGSVAIKPRLMKESGAEGYIDMLVNLGIRYDDDAEAQSTGKGKKAQAAHSESYIFCKVNEGRISRGEVMEFIDALDGFGVRLIKKENMIFAPYFPTRAVIVAREYPEDVFEYLKKLPRKNGQVYVDGRHIFSGRGIRGAPKDAKCIVEVYQWHEDDTAELVDY